MYNIQIKPHGGILMDRIIKGRQREDLLKRAGTLNRVILTEREISDLELIATGAYSPLEGFMLKEDYESVLVNKRLKNGSVWTIPITLSVAKEEARDLKENQDIALYSDNQEVLGVLHLKERYGFDKKKEAELIYKTTDEKHPGVHYVYNLGEILLGGKISLLNRPRYSDFLNYRLDPSQTRKIFKEKGWKRIVGFQTRNPIHRAHEHLLKSALEIVDGLLLNPIVGQTKQDDIPVDIRMRCYEVLLHRYFPKDRTILVVLPAAMRYAGPREAIFHAIIRKNFGCTHFIVGRDHAGVGKYYGSFDAQYIFDEFKKEELEITPLFFDNAFYCRHCQEMATIKSCPHPESEHLSLSGTRVRELLASGEIPPPEFTRPEIAEILLKWWRDKVD